MEKIKNRSWILEESFFLGLEKIKRTLNLNHYTSLCVYDSEHKLVRILGTFNFGCWDDLFGDLYTCVFWITVLNTRISK